MSDVPNTAGERFDAFGATEALPLSKLQKLGGAHLVRSWASIPHVTHNDEADVTALEAARESYATRYPDRRITSLAFHVKAICIVLTEFPKLNSSLDDSGELVILKKYYNIGIAVDTPKGLLVPVIRDANTKSVGDIAHDIQALSAKARSKGLPLSDLTGGSFSISSLGRHGGTSFTPIVNAPEVAILGLSRLQERPARDASGLAWRKMLPLSLSYDHRVINGAEAGAFVTRLTGLLARPEAWIE